jgi:WD40 repeat protein
LPVPPGHSSAELRNEAIACLALPYWRPLREWDGLPPETFHWDCDDRHRLYARSDFHGRMSVRRVDTDEVIAPLDGFPGENCFYFSPDGRFLIRAQRPQWRLWDLDSSPPALIVEEKSGATGAGLSTPTGACWPWQLVTGPACGDLETGDEVARIGPNKVQGVAFASGALLTNSAAGLCLWPIRPDPQPGTGWQVGPPRLLRVGTRAHISCSKDGQVTAQAASGGALVLHRDRPERALRLWPQGDVRSVAISPDGRFVGTGSHDGKDGLKIWDTEQRQIVKELRLGVLAQAGFSPDGRWLAARGEEGGHILTVGTWEEGPAVPFWVAAFSPDGNLLAVDAGHVVIRLLDPATGRDKARLEDPHQYVAGWLGFTPDGTRLVAVSEDGKAIHVWNLRRIRAGLARLDLDWDRLDHSPAPAAAPPLQVHVAGGDVLKRARADRLVRQASKDTAAAAENHAQALAALRQAVDADPRHALAHNNLAWLLLTGPKELRKPKEALAHARKAVKLAPKQATHHNTLGVALYRKDQFAEAVPALQKSLKEGRAQRMPTTCSS